MAEVKTYDPKSIALTVNGIPISGFADGEFISFEYDEDAFSKVTGADGISSRAKSNNNDGNLTITLQQTSPSNDVLTGIAVADKLSNTGVVPVILKDILGTTTIFSANGWIRRIPQVNYSKEISNREWVLDLSSVEVFLGGNQVP